MRACKIREIKKAGTDYREGKNRILRVCKVSGRSRWKMLLYMNTKFFQQKKEQLSM